MKTLEEIRRAVEADTEGRWTAQTVLAALEAATALRLSAGIAARLEALEADLRRVSDEHSRIIEINKAHCKTINSYLVLNSRQEDKIKALEAEIARRSPQKEGSAS